MKLINSISRVLGYVAMGLLLPMMLLTVTDVFLRFAFDSPITGTPELTALIMLCLVLGVSWCAARGRHVTVDLVMSRFSPRVQAIVDSITLLAGLGICVVITWQSVLTSIHVMRFGHIISVMLPRPTYPFYWLFVLGCAVLCLVLVTLLVRRIAEAVKIG